MAGGSAKYVVNAPMIPAELEDSIQPIAQLGEKIGRFLCQIVEGRFDALEIKYSGDFSTLGQNTKYITRMVLKGLLDPILQAPVNIVNALVVAQERGIAITESITAEASGFKNLITVKVKTDKMEEIVSGSILMKGRSRIVAVGGYTMDMIPEGSVIISRHLDKPGVIGRFSTILGRCNINIAGMQVGRINPGEEAIMILNVDDEVPQQVMDEMASQPGIFSAKFVTL